jgi:hypothetical protein
MKASDELYQLVQSLSKSEKRYVKVFASKDLNDEKSNYLRLFDALVDQNEYNESEIKSIFKGEPLANHLSSEKNYLYGFILKSMRSFHEDRSLDAQLKEWLLDAQYLFDKRLYDQSIKLLRKSKKTAYKFDRFFPLLEILFIERNIVLERSLKEKKKKIQEINAETIAVLNKIEEYTKLHYLKDILFIMTRDKYQMSIEQLEGFSSELSTFKRLSEMEGIVSFKTKQLYYFANALINLLQGNFKLVCEFYKKQITLWEQDDEILKTETSQYIKTLSNYLNSCLEADYFDDFPKVLDKIKSIHLKSRDEEAETFQNFTYLQLLYLMNTSAFDEAEIFVTEIENGLIEYKSKLNKARELAFYHNIALLYFAGGKFKLSLDWVNKILNSPKSDSRGDIQRFANVFQLILHYELENFDLLEYLIRSTYRNLQKNGNLYPFELLIISYIKKIINTEHKAEKNQSMKKFLEDLNKLKNSESNKLLGMLEVYCWIQSKLQNLPFKEILKKTYL